MASRGRDSGMAVMPTAGMPQIRASTPRELGHPDGLTRRIHDDVGRRRAGTNGLVVDDEADHHVHLIPRG